MCPILIIETMTHHTSSVELHTPPFEIHQEWVNIMPKPPQKCFILFAHWVFWIFFIMTHIGQSIRSKTKALPGTHEWKLEDVSCLPTITSPTSTTSLTSTTSNVFNEGSILKRRHQGLKTIRRSRASCQRQGRRDLSEIAED